MEAFYFLYGPSPSIHSGAWKVGGLRTSPVQGSGKLRKWLFLNILAAHSIEKYTKEDRDVGSNNLVYILVVIILVLVALLLLSRLI